MKTKLLITALVLLTLSGCTPPERNYGPIGEPTKVSPEGISYKVVTIEGRKFIATQTHLGYWTFAGPID